MISCKKIKINIIILQAKVIKMNLDESLVARRLNL